MYRRHFTGRRCWSRSWAVYSSWCTADIDPLSSFLLSLLCLLVITTILLTVDVDMDVDTVVQEALHREKMLEQKLGSLQQLVHNTQEAAEGGWQVCPSFPASCFCRHFLMPLSSLSVSKIALDNCLLLHVIYPGWLCGWQVPSSYHLPRVALWLASTFFMSSTAVTLWLASASISSTPGGFMADKCLLHVIYSGWLCS